MTKKETARAEAVAILKDWGLKDGSTVQAKINHVSSSGMSRNIGLYITAKNGDIVNISYWAAKAMEWRHKEGYNGGVVATGCGMDMCFATIDALSWAMGYGAICQDRDQVKPKDKSVRCSCGCHDIIERTKGCTECKHKHIFAIGLKYRNI